MYVNNLIQKLFPYSQICLLEKKHTYIRALVCSFNAMKTDQFVNFKFITSRISSAMQNATQENWFFEHEVIYRFWNYCATELSS